MSQAETRRKSYVKWRVDAAVHDALTVARKRSIGNPFRQVLAVVAGRSNLLRPQPVGGRVGWLDAELFLRATLALCGQRRAWVREPTDWMPAGESRFELFGSLARHLFATHPVPGFMTRVWLEEHSRAALRHQKLYKHLARGHCIRGADVPLSLTKPMARHFPEAPDHFTVEQALRWGQVRGLGGDARLAAALASTHLGTTFEREEEWLDVLKLLIARPEFDGVLVQPIIAYLRWSPRGGMRRAVASNMKELKFRRFLAKVEKWRLAVLRASAPRCDRWDSSGIGSYDNIELARHPWSVRRWTIHELTDRQSLIEEGKECSIAWEATPTGAPRGADRSGRCAAAARCIISTC